MNRERIRRDEKGCEGCGGAYARPLIASPMALKSLASASFIFTIIWMIPICVWNCICIAAVCWIWSIMAEPSWPAAWVPCALRPAAPDWNMFMELPMLAPVLLLVLGIDIVCS